QGDQLAHFRVRELGGALGTVGRYGRPELFDGVLYPLLFDFGWRFAGLNQKRHIPAPKPIERREKFTPRFDGNVGSDMPFDLLPDRRIEPFEPTWKAHDEHTGHD